MIAGGYFVLTGNWSWPVVWISIAYALAPTVVLFGKHIDKAPADQAKGIRTLPVLLGERVSKVAVLVMIAVQWLLLAWLVLTQALTPWVLLAAYAWPRIKHIWLAYTNPRPSVPPEGFPPDVWPLWYVAFAFSYTRRFGLGFLAGLIIDVALRNL
jgi:1,4-dihydroxy-2-naphthoate octaprenyltransferase